MIDNDEFLDKLFHACVTENVDIARTGGSVLLFLIKSADSMGIEKLLKSNLMQYLEKMFTYRDPEVMQSAVFSGANLLKNFPESYKSKLGMLYPVVLQLSNFRHKAERSHLQCWIALGSNFPAAG
jgi:hypothetical protein